MIHIFLNLKTNNWLKQVLNNIASKIVDHIISEGDIKGAIDKLKCMRRFQEKDLIQGVTNDLTEQLKNKEIELEMKSKMSYSNENAKEKDSSDKIRAKTSGLETKTAGIKNQINDNNIYDYVMLTTKRQIILLLTNVVATKFCRRCVLLRYIQQ